MPRDRLVCVLVLGIGLAGCATRPDVRPWGADVTPRPGGVRCKKAAVDALTHPATWAPLAAALFLQIDDWDGRISDWAASERPLFGSTDGAMEWSDDLLLACHGLYVATALATPSGREPETWIPNKARGFGVGIAARAVTYGGVATFKHATSRRRPDGSNRLSLPSGHASGAAVMATLAVRNARYIRAPAGFRAGIETLSAAAVLGTAWARVEGKKHYPSDVLVAIAIGHVVGRFMNDAFMGTEHGASIAGTTTGIEARIRIRLD